MYPNLDHMVATMEPSLATGAHFYTIPWLLLSGKGQATNDYVPVKLVQGMFEKLLMTALDDISELKQFMGTLTVDQFLRCLDAAADKFKNEYFRRNLPLLKKRLLKAKDN